jgi:malate dehydrogenase (oxaloacetate-decarboxylating)(NADP+)
MATGRSDYPNQVNNVLGFPYIFRGALDVRATTINEDMKIAAAQALANLAREDVPRRCRRGLPGRPAAFRAAIHHPGAVRSAPDLGDSRRLSPGPRWNRAWRRSRSSTWTLYAHELSARRDPIASTLQRIYERVRRHPRRVVFAEGEEEQVMRAAVSYVNQRLGTAFLLGPRGTDARNREAGGHRSRPAGSSSSSMRASHAGSMPIPTISMRGCSAKATCTAIASG